MNNEYELIITRIKYPKNDTTYYVYDSYDSLLKDLALIMQRNKNMNLYSLEEFKRNNLTMYSICYTM